MKETDSPLEARDIIQEDGGVVSFLWCGDEACGKELEEQVHVDILGIQEDADGTCVNCKQKARYRALLARTY
jgi:prolyl-tRNA synthetase